MRDWLLRHPSTGVLLVVALLLLLMGLFPGSQRPPEPTSIQETSRLEPAARGRFNEPSFSNPTTATRKLPDLAGQITYVLDAPIPFFLTLFAVLTFALVGMWRTFEWAYRMRLDKADFYIKIAGQEHDLREKIDERLAELDKKSTPDAEAKGVPSEREDLIHRRRAANTAVTQNLNAASTAASGRRDFVSATTLGSEVPHPPTAQKPDHR